jgi:Asp-tRNA(Asn)/Glu-tRNA(Gln) amidotransferase A subunit family amidase
LSTEGLPLGVQLVGKPFAERELIAMARWCEKIIGVTLDSVLD